MVSIIRYLIAITTIAIIVGCTPPEATQSVGVDGKYKVETLFTVDGCTVYRFSDGWARYFTNCSGTTMYSVPYNKSSRPDSIPGGMR